jgi:hypothetical protein
MSPGAFWVSALFALAVASAASAVQIGGTPVSGGNPTPGTPQPDPPNLEDRITVTGCLRPAWKSITSSDPNTPSNARFVLSSAQHVDRLPPGTGGSELARKTSSASYRLEGLDSQFTPFVNTRVEVSGEIKATAPTEAAAGAAPTLLVEFIQKTAPTCRS